MQGRMVIRPSLYLVAQMLNTEHQILALFFYLINLLHINYWRVHKLYQKIHRAFYDSILAVIFNVIEQSTHILSIQYTKNGALKLTLHLDFSYIISYRKRSLLNHQEEIRPITYDI